jgi:hypothetical protein
MNLGPTALLAAPGGRADADPGRSITPEPGWRRVSSPVTEVYPSTAGRVAGVPRDVLVAGVTYRTATHATWPGLRARSRSSCTRTAPSTRVDDFHPPHALASHGFVVASAEHPGNDYPSPLRGPAVLRTARSTCASLIDQFLAFQRRGGQLPRRGDRSCPHRREWLLTGGYAVTTLATGPSSSAPSPIHA